MTCFMSILFNVGPTGQIVAVHRFAASSLLAGPPTSLNVGPTGQIVAVHRFAASSLLAGPPTSLNVGPTGQIVAVHRFAASSLLAGPPTSLVAHQGFTAACSGSIACRYGAVLLRYTCAGSGNSIRASASILELSKR